MFKFFSGDSLKKVNDDMSLHNSRYEQLKELGLEDQIIDIILNHYSPEEQEAYFKLIEEGIDPYHAMGVKNLDSEQLKKYHEAIREGVHPDYAAEVAKLSDEDRKTFYENKYVGGHGPENDRQSLRSIRMDKIPFNKWGEDF